MATFKNVGKLVENDTGNPRQALDMVNNDYVGTLLAANMSQGTATARIAADLAAFATSGFAATAMTGLATQAFVNTSITSYVPINTVGQPNGPVPLDATGKVPPGTINIPSTQQWPTPLYSPVGYQTTPVTAGAPLQLFSAAVPYPGYNYRLMVTGMMDGYVPLTDAPTCFPEVLVRQGSTTGTIIAFGYGLGQSYTWGQAPLGGVNTVALGNTTEWAQYYTAGANGFWATPVSGIASWVGADGDATCRCRNLDAVFGKTTTPYQQISITITNPLIDHDATPLNASNDIYARMDVTGSYYVRCVISSGTASLWYSLNGANEIQIGSTVTASVNQAIGNVYTLYAGDVGTSNPRQFQLYKTRGTTRTLLATWTDTANATALGSAYQGWGFGAHTASQFFDTVGPSGVSSVTVQDSANPSGGVSAGTIPILPTALVGQTTQTASTTLYVMAQSSDQSDASKAVTITPVLPGLAIIPIPWAA